MRMHRKSHLDERLLSCGTYLTIADLTDKNMKNAAAQKEELNFAEIFGNNNPVHLEIGCGKGKFICELSARRPDINFIAVEKISNVLIEAVERAMDEGLKNVHFINSAAEVLPKYLKEGSIEKIYLNFSNPLPKLGYAKQRLTHPKFLQEYRQFLKVGGEIVQKTDDGDFYKFSLESFQSSGYEILERCEDLHALNDSENIVTEHEKKFADMGKNIYRIIAKS
ncbi:MAG: tRNA (guanosine(46)-N7)-methyltransferase TrmB [Clostridia bacterium]|nr:tRNA (guanosine(46)-N7)-methyltransferase TrmB [Clostridia bacterium]